jgi:hypothetical protein
LFISASKIAQNGKQHLLAAWELAMRTGAEYQRQTEPIDVSLDKAHAAAEAEGNRRRALYAAGGGAGGATSRRETIDTVGKSVGE